MAKSNHEIMMEVGKSFIEGFIRGMENTRELFIEAGSSIDKFNLLLRKNKHREIYIRKFKVRGERMKRRNHGK